HRIRSASALCPLRAPPPAPLPLSLHDALPIYGVILRDDRKRADVRARQDLAVPEGHGNGERDQRRDGGRAAPIERPNRRDPAVVEDGSEDAIAVMEPTVVAGDRDAGESKELAPRRRRVVRDGHAARNLAEQHERLPLSPASLRELVPNAVQVRIFFRRPRREKELPHDPVDVVEPAALARDGARDALREIRLPAGPSVNAPHELAAVVGAGIETGRELHALLEREILRLDREPVDERRDARILAQHVRRSDAEHNEIETRVLGLAVAARVTRVYRREELPRERQRQRALDLVDEYRDRHRRVRQHDISEELREPELARERALLLPPALEIDLEAQLAQHAIRDAVVPARRVAALAAHADLAQIDDGRKLSGTTQIANRSRNEARSEEHTP